MFDRQSRGMTYAPRMPTRARTLGLAVVLSIVALACADTSADSPAVGGNAEAAATSSDVTEGRTGGDRDRGDGDRSSSNSAAGNHNQAADTATHTAAMSLVDQANATHIAATRGRWSSTTTWGDEVPVTGSLVHIPAGLTVTIDAQLDPEIERIGVDGTLRFATDADTELKVDTLVTTADGTLEIGTPERPVEDDVVASIQFADDCPIDRSQDPGLISRGALLHGTTVIQGGAVTHRATVTVFPRTGDTSIDMNGELIGWDAGDEIVVTGTDGATSDERRIITSVDRTTVRFAEPLQQNHVPPANDLDLYVANLTRNVQFSSENSEIGRRGHLMVMHTLDAQIRGARFTDMGRTDKSTELSDVDFGEIEPGASGGTVRSRSSTAPTSAVATPCTPTAAVPTLGPRSPSSPTRS